MTSAAMELPPKEGVDNQAVATSVGAVSLHVLKEQGVEPKTAAGEADADASGELEAEDLELLNDDEELEVDDDIAPVKKPEKDKSGPSSDAVRDYLKKIGKVRLLEHEEVVDLAKRIETGVFAQEKLDIADEGELSPQRRRDLRFLARDGARAKDHMLEANLRLVVSMAKRYTGLGLPFLDLIQEGNIGLVRAVEKYDYQKGYRFSTYATWWIRQAMARSVADQARTIRLPVQFGEQLNNLKRAKAELHKQLGRHATLAELSHETGLSEEKIADYIEHDQVPVSLETPVGDESEGQGILGDLIEDGDAYMPEDVAMFTVMRDDLWAALGKLSERQRTAIILRHGLDGQRPRTYEQIGRVIGVSHEIARQAERRGVAQLKVTASAMQEYLAG